MDKMKAYNNLFTSVVDYENLYNAYVKAKRGKRYRIEALRFKENLEENLIELQNELIWNMYTPLPYRQFWVSDPKRRLISAPAFRDRVVHHALVQVIEPIFEKKFISDSFACRKGLGTHAAVARIQHFARIAHRNYGEFYVLKLDVHRFFPSINHAILKKEFARAISDKMVNALYRVVIDSFETDGRGLPIGALTSQLSANIYLNALDHFIKDICGARYYVRYMDDMIILHPSKQHLRRLWILIEGYLNAYLDLELNPKSRIFLWKQGIDFCGYRIWPTHIKPKKATIQRTRRRLKRYAELYRSNPRILEKAKQSILSFLGYTKHCRCRTTTIGILNSIVFQASNVDGGVWLW
jgi:retron-type reverse transcriptase